jgi:hypothetical protein
VSKRHQNNRRKSYGRRQHELYERRGREYQPEMDLGSDDVAAGALVDRLAFLDPRSPRLRYATGE